MPIKEYEYFENKQETLNELDNYTKRIVPNLEHNQKNMSFIFQDGERVLGRIVGFIHWNYLQIELFFVSPDTQGKGIGSKLLEHIEKVAQENQLSYILLETMSFNAPKFYEKHGFSLLADIKNSPLEGEHCYFYIKYC